VLLLQVQELAVAGKGTADNVATRFVAYAGDDSKATVAVPIHAIDLVLACSGRAASSPRRSTVSTVARTSPRAPRRQLPRLKWPSSDSSFYLRSLRPLDFEWTHQMNGKLQRDFTE
jgi:hypothetical protein